METYDKNAIDRTSFYRNKEKNMNILSTFIYWIQESWIYHHKSQLFGLILFHVNFSDHGKDSKLWVIIGWLNLAVSKIFHNTILSKFIHYHSGTLTIHII